MNPTTTPDALLTDRPRLAMTQATLYHISPLRSEIADFHGDETEGKVDALLHELSMAIASDGEEHVQVRVCFERGHAFLSTHRLRPGCTDGGVRQHVLKTLQRRVAHPSIREPGETEGSLKRLCDELCGNPEPYTVRALRELVKEPPPPDAGAEDDLFDGWFEHHSALSFALDEGVSSDEAVRRAYVQARAFAPHSIRRSEIWSFAVGVTLAHEASRAVLDHRKSLHEREAERGT